MSNTLTAEVCSALSIIPGINVIITIGNTLRADDGVGPYIGLSLTSSDRVKIVNADYTPENVIEQVISLHPAKIIFIDAADFQGAPGEARVIDQEHIPDASLSTHAVPLKVVYHLLLHDTGAMAVMVGIQPQSVDHKEELSGEVKATADEIIKYINRDKV
ncbi:MAG: hydrogenase 3 maturation endopeptidase HyCI [bacterium]|nr:hydrogenase 3 maturation endopeptidase HyCI [bacterium]MDD5353906.1 hydrogenase 3 maturation endopeptidase HyCI [bacterium]MDD5757020.1 hydrogenase 3 maturation endopeptidase HyCI [bacterium]